MTPIVLQKTNGASIETPSEVISLTISELRSIVVLCSRALVNMDEHVVQEVNAREDNFTLIELSDVLDSVIVKVALYCTDLIVEHESVDEHRTYLTEEDR